MTDNHQEVPDNTSCSGNEVEPKSETKTANKKAYMRKYYHEKQKEEVQCEFCERTFSCKSSMVHHMRNSQKCAITQALVALEELNKHAEHLKKFARHS